MASVEPNTTHMCTPEDHEEETISSMTVGSGSSKASIYEVCVIKQEKREMGTRPMTPSRLHRGLDERRRGEGGEAEEGASLSPYATLFRSHATHVSFSR